MDVTGLAKAVAEATGPDQELDAKIECEFGSVEFCKTGEVPRYTASLDEAIALMNRVLTPVYGEKPDFILGRTNGGLTIHCRIGETKEHFGETEPLALLLALLHAIENKEDNGG